VNSCRDGVDELRRTRATLSSREPEGHGHDRISGREKRERRAKGRRSRDGASSHLVERSRPVGILGDPVSAASWMSRSPRLLPDRSLRTTPRWQPMQGCDVSRVWWRCRNPGCTTPHGAILGRVTTDGGLVLAPAVVTFAAYLDSRRVVVACPACGITREFRGSAVVSGRGEAAGGAIA